MNTPPTSVTRKHLNHTCITNGPCTFWREVTNKHKTVCVQWLHCTCEHGTSQWCKWANIDAMCVCGSMSRSSSNVKWRHAMTLAVAHVLRPSNVTVKVALSILTQPSRHGVAFNMRWCARCSLREHARYEKLAITLWSYLHYSSVVGPSSSSLGCSRQWIRSGSRGQLEQSPQTLQSH